MVDAPFDLKTAVRDRFTGGAPRQVWTPVDFLDLGSRDAVDKTLQRFAKAGELRRIDRGLYDRPGFNALTQKPTTPDPGAVIDAIARRDQTRMLIDGMTAANDLGLSDAVPAHVVVHTDARLKPVQLGNLVITFKPTAPSKLYWAGRPAMRVVQALHWSRDMLSREGERDRVLQRLTAVIDDPKYGHAIRADLDDGLPALPAWMQDFVRILLGTDEPREHSDNRHPAHPGDQKDDDHRDDQSDSHSASSILGRDHPGGGTHRRRIATRRVR